jgi:hypothetical protein
MEGTMRKHLTPGTVLGTVAVVFACTGSATAGALITSGSIKDNTIQARDIKKGTITQDRLAASVRKQLTKAGTAGPAGPAGPAGATTTVLGSAPQAGKDGVDGKDGAAGKDGVNGTNGTNGVNGANAATVVAANTDGGWHLVGGAGNSTYPQASFSSGELRLQGGFDATSPVGAIGIMRAFDSPQLSSLKSLSYDFRVLKRPAGNSVSAPTIHVTVYKANTVAGGTGFSNFVFEPYLSSDFGVNQRYSIDALAGKWWSTRQLKDKQPQQALTWAELLAHSPDATVSAISFDNGGTSSGTIPAADFQAGVDNAVIGFGDSFTRYDFGG